MTLTGVMILHLALVDFISDYRDTGFANKTETFSEGIEPECDKSMYIYMHTLEHIISKLVVGSGTAWCSQVKKVETLLQ